jgi:hypothetical protein
VVVIVVRCDACGGTVTFDADHARARCRFCAAVALVPVPLDRPPPPPREVIPFAIDEALARERFATWTRSSWWHARDLGAAVVQLRPLWLPAWRARAEVELHWAGLVRADTRSGRRPRSGIDRAPAQALVPASLGISQRELDALGGFSTRRRPWLDDDAEITRELPNLTEAGARAQIQRALQAERLREVTAREHLHDAGATARLHGVALELDALPIYIGAFAYRGRPWRIVVHGESGRLVGRAPLDRVKVTIAVVLAAIVALAVALWLERREPDPPAPSPAPVSPGR